MSKEWSIPSINTSKMWFSFLLPGLKKARYKTWTEEDISAAMVAVRRDNISCRRAAAQFNIPKSTLLDRLSGRHGTPGTRAYLTQEDETKLAAHLINITNQGYAKGKEIILHMATQIAIKQGKVEKGGRLGTKWWRGFTKRNPQISQTTSQGSRFTQTLTTAATADMFYRRLWEIMSDNIFGNLQEKPHLIFNVDESLFEFDSVNQILAAVKDLKRIPQIPKDQHEGVTVLACSAAIGNRIPPTFIFRSASGRLPHSVLEDAPTGSLLTALKIGWLDKDFYLKWFHEIFLKSIPAERPVLLLVDGRNACITEDFIQAATDNNIFVVCLPAQVSCVLQPLDLSLEGPLKEAWISACTVFQDVTVLNQRNFAKVFNTVWNSNMTSDMVKSGFCKSGIFPFHPEAFDRSKLVARKRKRHCAVKSDTTVGTASSLSTLQQVPNQLPSVVTIPSVSTSPLSPPVPGQNLSVGATPFPVHICSEDLIVQPIELSSSFSQPTFLGPSLSSDFTQDVSSVSDRLASPVVDTFDALISLEYSIGRDERDRYRRGYKDDHSLLGDSTYIMWKKLVTGLGGLRKASRCPCKTACSCSCSGFGFCECLGCGVLPVKSMQTTSIPPSQPPSDALSPSLANSMFSGEVRTHQDFGSVVVEPEGDFRGAQKRRRNGPDGVQSKHRRKEREPQRRKSR